MTKNILITGASSGIGLKTALVLKQRGYHVFATARKQEDLDKLQKEGIDALWLDLNDLQSIEKAVKTLEEKTQGNIDVLINNASYAQPGAIEDLSQEAIKAQFQANVFGPLYLTQLILKLMRRQGNGRIIQIGSLLGYVTMPFRGAYNASKFALEAITDTLRQELAKTNIHVSIIEPGPISSNLRQNAKDKFQTHIDETNSQHAKTYENMRQDFFKLTQDKAFYLPPEAVTKKILHAIEKKRPKARYYVGFPAYLFMVLRRLLPTKLLDKIILEVLKHES